MSDTDRASVIENLSKSTDLHDEWISGYRSGTVARQLNAIMDRLFVRAGLARPQSILDAGCGSGANVERLLQYPLRITAVDFSEAMVEVCKQRFGDRVDVRQGDLTRLQFPDAHFDAVLCSGVLMHIPDYEQALAELVRVLKPGGRLLLTECNSAAIELRLRMLVWRLTGKDHKVVAKPEGVEVWSDGEHGPLLARSHDRKWLIGWLAGRDVKLEWWGSGLFTEIFQTFSSGLVFRAAALLNSAWFRLRLPPHVSTDALYVFHKAGSG